MTKSFSKEELANYNGEKSLSILIACDGKIYDVTESNHWRGGKHHTLHQAGQDVTEAIKKAPHRLELLEKLPIVGLLED